MMLSKKLNPPPWTDKEIEILKNKYSTSTIEEMLLLLPGRNWSGIKHKASRLNIKCRGNLHRIFWKYINKLSNVFGDNGQYPTQCWIWIGTLFNDGYGRVCKKGGGLSAHRASWEIHNGTIPDDKIVCHKCDHKRCVNPEHLFLGTNNDNSKDMVLKNRQYKKIDKSEYKNIINMKLNGIKLKDIATLYNVRYETIRRIIRL